MPSVLREPHKGTKPSDLLPEEQGGPPQPSLGTIRSQENAYDPWVSINIDISYGLHHPVKYIHLK